MLDTCCGVFVMVEGKIYEVNVGVLNGIMGCTLVRGGSDDEVIWIELGEIVAWS